MSGGVDSMTIWKMKKEIIDEIVYIDYNHHFKEKEFSVLQKLNIIPTIIKIEDMKKDERGFFFGRNLKFMIAVREYFINEDICVYFGNCAEDNFSDNAREYIYRVEQIINNSFPKNTIRIICPLQDLSKKEIINLLKTYAENKEIKPYWCDSGEEEACGICHSCQAMKGIKI